MGGGGSRREAVKALAVCAVWIWGAVAGAGVAAADPSSGPSIHGEYSLIGALHWTGGSGDKTLIQKGQFLTNELKLQASQPLGPEWTLDADVRVRKTNDPQIDHQPGVHVLGATVELYNPFLRITGGDFYGDFTPYTLTQALEGLQVAFKNERWEIKGVAARSRRHDEGRYFERYVFGGRAEAKVIDRYGPLQDVSVGGNFSDVEDDAASIDNRTGVVDFSNRVGSANLHALLWEKSDWEAEFAKSWEGADTPTAEHVDRKTGAAVRVNGVTRFSNLTRLSTGYEWVSAGFDTLAGSSVPDRVQFTNRLNHKLSPELSLEAGYRIQYDKLEESELVKRTVTQSPRVALSWQPAAQEWLLKDYEARAFWEMRGRMSQDDPTGQTDFTTNDVGIDQSFKIAAFFMDSGWTYRIEDDDLILVNRRTGHSGYSGLRTRTEWFGAQATPSLRYQFDFQDIPKEGGSDFIQSVSAGLDLQFSPGLRVDQRYSVSAANLMVEETDSVRFTSHVGLDYKLPYQEDLWFKLSYDTNDLAHTVSTQRYSEQNLQGQLLWKF